MTGNISLSWEHVEHLSHKVRNVVRRGYLKKTYYDKDLMQARIKTGHGIENDRIDIMHPVGYLGRVQPDDKAEVFTMDVGGDSSRRVVLGVLGDRKSHPKVLEGESILYSPGDPKNFLRVFKKPPKKQNGGGEQQAEGGEEGGEEGGGEQSPDSKEAIYGKYGETYCLFDGKKAQTYYKDEKKSTQCDDDHVHIRFEDIRIWIDKENPWSTKPILIKQDPDSKAAKLGGVDESLPYDWDEATDTWAYRGSMKFNGPANTFKGDVTINGKAVVDGAVTFNNTLLMKNFVTLHADPVQPMHAVTKQYSDNAGGNLKAYVDSQDASEAAARINGDSAEATARFNADTDVINGYTAADSALYTALQNQINALTARVASLEAGKPYAPADHTHPAPP
jgi:hypothetical protein